MSYQVRNSSPAYERLGGWGVKAIVSELRAARERWRTSQQRSLAFAVREFPSRDALKEIADALCGALFPMRLGPSELHQEGEDFYVGHTLDSALNGLFLQVQLELGYNHRHREGSDVDVEEQAALIVKDFASQLPELRGLLDTDVEAAYLGDPAARNVDEVLLCYPGIQAVIYYRLAHALYERGVPLIARIVSEVAHSATGIDIHPGAQIGAGFFIDHGTGVVIGETCVIGARVKLYQGVTLGALSVRARDRSPARRHPTIEDDVTVYAGATILGGDTIIGRGSTIGGNVWLTRSVPPGTTVVLDTPSLRFLASEGRPS